MTRVATASLVERQRRRLRWAFRAALLAAGVSPAIQACAHTTAADSPDGAEPTDSATGSDATGMASETDGGAAAAIDGDLDCSAARNVGCNTIVFADAIFVTDASDAEICPLVLPCGLPSGVKADGCNLLDSVTDAPIGCRVVAGCVADAFQPGACGSIGLECYCDNFVGGGRRLSGSRRPGRVRARDAVGAYFARMADEEAASVHAFAALQRELTRHGAPEELVREARRAERDEVRHARSMTGLARRYGGEPSPHRAPASSRRSLEALARENAVEGCVRETFAALMAAWQARRADDPAARRSLERIAADEARHAALAWAIAAWVEPTLDAGARSRIARARSRAVGHLKKQLSRPVSSTLAARAGMPRPAEARSLLAAMMDGLCGRKRTRARFTRTPERGSVRGLPTRRARCAC
jgi:hypothetical protein